MLFSLERFLLPYPPSTGAVRNSSWKLSLAYWKNNAVLVSFISVYMLINFILFITRAIQYRNHSFVYILARASGIYSYIFLVTENLIRIFPELGQALNFNCAFVVVLMLRHCITSMRMCGMANYLPLDHHVYLHKLCGTVIVFFSALHTLMHLISFRP